jgi:hypothetical protein
MKVEFWLMEPGNHRPIEGMEMDAVPRVGELVALSADGPVREVHSVAYTLVPPRQVARVMLRF